ncbi:MAG: hypothetical protein WD766_03630 [Gemmatimonadota bacterium]
MNTSEISGRAAGERNPFRDADWTASWRRSGISEAGWAELRAGLREEARRWQEALSEPREVDRVALNGIVASIAHLTYHLGAIRQIDRVTRGPAAEVGTHGVSRDRQSD